MTYFAFFLGAFVGVAVGLLIARITPQAISVEVNLTRTPAKKPGDPVDPADYWKDQNN